MFVFSLGAADRIKIDIIEKTGMGSWIDSSKGYIITRLMVQLITYREDGTEHGNLDGLFGGI